ncbi:L-arabinose transport system permease protein AraQ [Thermoflexales bacterium]|nr:L-arabinose transport system permease protein AraQ [Thermoflexales bacterium]
MKPKSYRRLRFIRATLIYAVLISVALFMLFPFIYMLTTSLKEPKDTFVYPPRLLPRQDVAASIEGQPDPLPLYEVQVDGQTRQYALVESNIRVGIYADPSKPAQTYERRLTDVSPTGGAENQQTVMVEGQAKKLWNVEVDGQIIPMTEVRQTAVGRFVDPQNPQAEVYRNVRLSQPVQNLTAHPENYQEVVELQNMDRSLTNTMLVTFLVVVGQLTTSILGGYAFARLKFPGRNALFVIYLGTIMIPFVVLITPLYQLMVAIGWVDRVASLIIPWMFTAYGTFLMRQAFITIPKEIEEAALIDGASRWQILLRIFVPATVPSLATLATFTFLYAWNSFFWPLVIINTGNEANHVLTLSLNVLRGRASDTPNLILAGAAISIIPPVLLYILAQRFFVESATSSGVKG